MFKCDIPYFFKSICLSTTLVEDPGFGTVTILPKFTHGVDVCYVINSSKSLVVRERPNNVYHAKSAPQLYI